LLKHPTLDQLRALGLHGMAAAFTELNAGNEADGLGHLEWLALLLDREASWRQDKRFAARLRHAKLRQQACVEDIDYRNPRGLDRALFQKLAEILWGARQGYSILAVEPTEGKAPCHRRTI
jgi:DNA replication protein DnaC